MQRKLKCAAAAVAMLLASTAGAVPGVPPAVPTNARLPSATDAQALMSLPAPTSRNLRLDCEKISLAQASLKTAETQGPRLLPMSPESAPPGPDSLYHIARNQQRMAAMAERYGCDVK